MQGVFKAILKTTSDLHVTETLKIPIVFAPELITNHSARIIVVCKQVDCQWVYPILGKRSHPVYDAFRIISVVGITRVIRAIRVVRTRVSSYVTLFPNTWRSSCLTECY